MIDTLMVLWTKGILARSMRLFIPFLLLLTGICLVLFLTTMSGMRWPGLAFNGTSPRISQASANSSLAPTPLVTPGTSAIIIPVILPNPTPTATLLPTPEPVQTNSVPDPVPTPIVQPVQSRKYYAPPSVPKATPIPTQEPTEQPTVDDNVPPWFSNAITANGRLAGSLETPASLAVLPELFWAALLASVCMALCGLGLIFVLQRKKRQSHS